ncbi:MAG: hypothetical protein JJU21_16765 [Salinarimonas sp.]|nr:hypothetical protein [Salinarimonas sp.]
MQKLTVDDVLKQSIRDAFDAMAVAHEEFEFGNKFTYLVEAMRANQSDDQDKTLAQSENNEIFSIIIENQINHYQRDYNAYPETVRRLY